jgi:exopolysaccharide biosynthesis polyprenyl glycosylphosphotransferase
MISEQYKVFKKIIIFFDLLLILVSFFIGYFLRDSIYNPLLGFEILPLAHLNFYFGLLPVLLILWWGLLSYFGMYKSFYTSMADSFLIILKSALIGFVIFGSYIFVLKMQDQVSRLVIVFTFVFSVILLGLEKAALTYAFKIIGKRNKSFRSSLIIFRRIVIIGTGKRVRRFITLVEKNPGWGINIVGLIDIDPVMKGRIVNGYKVLGSFEDMPEIVKQNVIDEALFIVPRSWLDKIEGIMQFCESVGLRVNLAADLYKLKFSKAKHTDIGGFPLLTFESTPDRFGYLFMKRLFDFFISGITLLCLSLFFLIIAVIIKTTSKGQVFYRQQRCSLYGRKFTLYKFRTMTVDAESKLKELIPFNEMNGPVFKMTNDPRITKAGKWLRRFSLDELPQLWNVFKGDMSLVGPRPPIPDEVENYNDWQRRRLSMRPGITCLWQVSGRSKISDFNEWMKLDLDYINNWSLWLDIKILIRTIPVVLFGIGAK